MATTQELVQRAIAAYDRGDHNITRMILGSMLTKPKAVKLTTFAKLHALPYCYCVECCPIRKQEAREAEVRMIAEGILSPTWKTDKAAWDRRSKTTPAQDYKEKVRAALSICACGHLAQHHDRDELENLLSCTHIDYIDGNTNKPCNCTHFHYESSGAIENEAA